MKAPSEKHLEDWIVANQSTFLQEFIGMDGQRRHCRIVDSIIGRQTVLPSGRLDLLGVCEDGIVVVELKKDKADSECLAQLIRYMGDLQGIYRSKLHQMRRSDKNFPVNQSFLMSDPASVSGIMISQGLVDEKLMFVADAANIGIVNYTYLPEQNSYAFFTPSHASRYIEISNAHDEYADGFIGIAFAEIIERWASYYRWDDKQNEQ